MTRMRSPCGAGLAAVLAVGLAALSCPGAAWADSPAPVDAAGSATPSAAAAPAAATPAAADAAPPPAERLATPPGGMAVALREAASRPSWHPDVALMATAAQMGQFTIDRTGAKSPKNADLYGRLHFGVGGQTGRWLGRLLVRGALSGELLSGGWGGLTPLPGDRLPASREGKLEPTEAWLGVNWNHIAELRGGLMGSSWGNGLVARDGRAQAMDQQWFYVPTVGDRVVRGALVLTPFRNTSSALRGLAVSFAVDRVFADDVLYEGDSASQLVGSVRWFVAEDQWLGLYYAGRSQTADSGRGLDVSLVDAAFDVKVATPLAPLRLQGEAALIAGTTTLAPSPDFAKHDVLQGAAQLRSTAQLTPGLRAQLDLAWLSGDANLGDGQVSAFKADPNAQLGIVLFPRVLAWQSGRARLTASDPNLVGQPPEDLDRLATGGALTNSWVVFPKLGHTFLQRGEVYGGALLAWTSVPLADPRWTVSEGAGSPRNFLGNAATSSLLGAEFDAGVRWRMPVPHYPAHLLLCAEAGVLLPGGALAGLNDPIPAGRVTLAWLGHEAP